MTLTGQVPRDLDRWQRFSLFVAIAAGMLSIGALYWDWQQFLRAYLFGFLFWTGIAIGCLGVLMLHHVVGGKWGLIIRRVLEAGACMLPWMGLLFLPILLDLPVLYPWARPGAMSDPVIQSKAAYLNVPFFVARTAIYFALWTMAAVRLTRWSGQLDVAFDLKRIASMRKFSAHGLIVLTLTATFAFVDWIMSLEPHWFSTIYGAMFLIGETMAALAFVIAIVLALSQSTAFRPYITEQHVHDLGNIMFAFMVLWAYLSFSQFLIIWSGNLPTETPWYVSRLNGGWGAVALAIVVFHFAIPFLLLLMRGVKRRAERLFRVCLLLLAARFVNVYWITAPAFTGPHFTIHWEDLVVPAAIGGLWCAMFFRHLKTHPILPLGDPRLAGPPRETVAY